MDKFSQLVQDLEDGSLGLTHIQSAIRASIRNRKDIPDGIKDLLCGRGSGYAGLIYHMFEPIGKVIGSMELAYRRGTDGKHPDPHK